MSLLSKNITKLVLKCKKFLLEGCKKKEQILQYLKLRTQDPEPCFLNKRIC